MPRKAPCFPHAKVNLSEILADLRMLVMLSGPTGSADAPYNARGSVDRNANRLTISTRPYPHAIARRWHRSIVGSLASSSAVLGLSMTKQMAGLFASHSRHSR